MRYSTREFPRPSIILIYIKDLPNCSNALTFRIFADDTNVFASARNLKDLEEVVNSELKKVKIWCDVNRLSINFTKTNFMIQGHPTTIFGKYLFGRRFKIYTFRNICCKISCLPASPRIFENLKNGIIAYF